MSDGDGEIMIKTYIEIARAASGHDFVSGPLKDCQRWDPCAGDKENSQNCALNGQASSCCAASIDEHPVSVPRALRSRERHSQVLI